MQRTSLRSPLKPTVRPHLMATSLIALLFGAIALLLIARDLRWPRGHVSVASRIVRATPFVVFAGLSLIVAARAPHGRHAFQFDLSLSASDISRSLTKVPHLRGYAVLLLLAVLALGVHRLLLALLTCSALGIACELAQATVVGHHARLADLAPNFLGCLASLLLIVGVRAFLSSQRQPLSAPDGFNNQP